MFYSVLVAGNKNNRTNHWEKCKEIAFWFVVHGYLKIYFTHIHFSWCILLISTRHSNPLIVYISGPLLSKKYAKMMLSFYEFNHYTIPFLESVHTGSDTQQYTNMLLIKLAIEHHLFYKAQISILSRFASRVNKP